VGGLHGAEFHYVHDSKNIMMIEWGGWDVRGMWRAWECWEMHTEFWSETLGGVDRLLF
jgi:hypothetical protein